MLTILLHSSKTMVPTAPSRPLTTPVFLDKASDLRGYISSLSSAQLAKSMHVSAKLAEAVSRTYDEWSDHEDLSAAAEVFRGDIYSGLRALDYTEEQKQFAQDRLVILSGLYGALKPYDGISPYRLEAAYRFPDEPYRNLYTYWGHSLAAVIPAEGPIVNVTSAEYETLVVPYIDRGRIITPKFLTQVKPDDEPKFVAVHAKIARGAYARWLIQRGRDDAEGLEEFHDLGYRYDAQRSTPEVPVYVTAAFGGIGLSQRLA